MSRKKKIHFLKVLLSTILPKVPPLCLPVSRHRKNKFYYSHFRIRKIETQYSSFKNTFLTFEKYQNHRKAEIIMYTLYILHPDSKLLTFATFALSLYFSLHTHIHNTPKYPYFFSEPIIFPSKIFSMYP